MSLQTTEDENLKNVSMLELAERVLQDENKATHFKDIFAKIEDVKDYSNEEVTDRLAQFYTDLNLDGRFLTVGENMWGLKRWYPVEQIDEVITAEPKKKKSSKKKKAAKKKKEPEPEPEPEAEDVSSQDTPDYKDDIDELTRDLPKGDDEENTAIPDAADIGDDEEHVPELGEENDDTDEEDDESEEDEKES